MKKFLLAAALMSLSGLSLATDVGVSVSIGQPGFYGRIVLGNVPQPQVIYTTPVVIQPAPIAVIRQPIYLRVPPGHEKNWAKHCQRYNACGQPVYFVQDGWYQQVYSPYYRNEQRYVVVNPQGDQGHGHGYDKHKKDKKHKGRGHE
jgi:hypothetical protein